MPLREYTWNPVTDSIIEETDGAGNVLAEYHREPSEYGPLLSELRNGQTRMYHFDALGNTRVLTDQSQSITDEFTYDAWGNEIARSGSTYTPFRWVGAIGYVADIDVNAYCARTRTYFPLTARFSARDPMESEATHNLYVYCSNIPVSRIDPSGMVELVIIPPGVVNHPWKYKNGGSRAHTDVVTDTIDCECQRCENCEELKCKMRLETLIRIRRNTHPQARPNMYGHEQRHVINYQSEFTAIAWFLARCEWIFRCGVPDCDPEPCLGMAKARWRAFRLKEAAHLNPPFDPDTAPSYLPDPIGPFPPPQAG